ncbi:MAG: hypothetical protein LKJ21_04080 [Oscillospiraceae bacterium]|nr:hypothetical protein [Oscillospiraceae bacterium]
MADYAKMYHELFGAVTKAIQILQQAQIDTEEIYISAKEPAIKILPKNEDSDREDNDSR